MAKYSKNKIRGCFTVSDSAPNNAEGRTTKGRALEDLIRYIFEKIPGIAFTESNQQNAFLTEEIDLAFWNDRAAKGFDFLPSILLVECKNWSNAVDTEAVVYFLAKIKSRGLDFGILIAANGITGDPALLTRANVEITTALAGGVRLIVITREEIEALATTNDFIILMKRKLCKLIVTGAVQTVIVR